MKLNRMACDDGPDVPGLHKDKLSERMRKSFVYYADLEEGIMSPSQSKLYEEVAKLEADLEERTHQYHLAHAKILSREAIIKQLEEMLEE